MNTKLSIFLVTLLTITSCTCQNKATEQEKTAPANNLTITPPQNLNTEEGRITFNEGQNKFLSAYQTNITFKKLVEDSRCPKGVDCVWEGAAVVELEFMGTYSRPFTVQLATINNKEKNLNKEAYFNGYKISLVEVNPYPTSPKMQDPHFTKPMIVVEITKATEKELKNNFQ